MTALVLVRHGSTSWSERGRLQGWAPIGLSASGIREAHAIGRRARDMDIARVITSPLCRARETAAIVAPYLRLPVDVTYALCELNYGDVTGSTVSELEQRAPRLAQAWRERPWQVRFAARHGALTDVAGLLAELLARAAASTTPTLCVTHGHVIRTAMILCRQLAAPDFWRLDVPTASIWAIDAAGASAQLGMPLELPAESRWLP